MIVHQSVVVPGNIIASKLVKNRCEKWHSHSVKSLFCSPFYMGINFLDFLCIFAELYFLISKFLSNGPLKKTAKVSEKRCSSVEFSKM